MNRIIDELTAYGPPYDAEIDLFKTHFPSLEVLTTFIARHGRNERQVHAILEDQFGFTDMAADVIFSYGLYALREQNQN